MRYIRYTAHRISELGPNICVINGVCKKQQRFGCDKEGKCLMQLCENDRRKLAKVSVFASWKYDDKTSKKIDRAVEKWRKGQYKKCSAVEYIIKRIR